MMRDVAPYVPLFFDAIDQWTVQPSRVFVLENDSSDDTWDALIEAQSKRDGVVVCEQIRTGVSLFPREATAARSAHLAAVRNLLIEFALSRDSTWTHALFLDAQKWLDEDGLERLVAANRPIIAPAVRLQTGTFYDTWCFRDVNNQPFVPSSTGRGVTGAGAVGGVMLVDRRVLDAGHRYEGTDGSSCDSVPFCASATADGFDVAIDWDVQSVACRDAPEYRRFVDISRARRARGTRVRGPGG